MDTSMNSATNSILSRLRCAAGTDVGKKREENQDSFGIAKSEDFQLFMVADGMGGVKGGAIASRLAIATLEQAFHQGALRDVETLKLAVRSANGAIYKQGSSDESLNGMGTTLIGLLFSHTASFIFNVGDSRVYRVRNEEVRQLTEDHTLVSELVKSGALSEDQAENHPVSHMLTRSLGPQPEIDVDCWPLGADLDSGDYFVLCSDGLYNFVNPDEIGRIVRDNSLDDASQILIALANKRGGTDNITVLIVNYTENEETARKNELDEDMHSDADPEVRRSNKEKRKVSSEAKGEDQRKLPLVLVIIAALVFGLVIGRLVGNWKPEGISTKNISLEETKKALDIAPSTASLAEKPSFDEISDALKKELETADSEVVELVEPQAPVLIPDRVRLKRIADTLKDSLLKIQEEIAILDKDGAGNSMLASVKKTRDDLQLEREAVESEIDKASRKLSQWYARQKRLESQDPLKLAAEVGAAAPSVQDLKESFERATYEFIKRRDEYELYPSDERLRDQVQELKEGRVQALRKLQIEVRKVVNQVLSETDQEIESLKLKREILGIQLEAANRDLEVTKVISNGTKGDKEQLKGKLVERRESLKSSLGELETSLGDDR